MTFPAASQTALAAWLAQGKMVASSPTGLAVSPYAAKNVRVIYRGTRAETNVDLYTLAMTGCGPLSVTPSAASVDVGVQCTGASMVSGF
jgi:hypothetical protein